jgi:hypothetical protein
MLAVAAALAATAAALALRPTRRGQGTAAQDTEAGAGPGSGSAAPAPTGAAGAPAVIGGPPPAAPPYVPRGYVPESAVKPPAASSLPRPAPIPRGALDRQLAAPRPEAGSGSVDGDRPPRPVPGLR